MSKIGTELPTEYSDRFDELRQNRVEVSFYKYGTAKDNFGEKLVNALESQDRKSTRLNSSHSQQSRMPSSA